MKGTPNHTAGWGWPGLASSPPGTQLHTSLVEYITPRCLHVTSPKPTLPDQRAVTPGAFPRASWVPGLGRALGSQRQTRQIRGWSPRRGCPALGRSRRWGAQGTHADVRTHLCLSRLEGERELLAHSGWGPGMLSNIPQCTENDQASNVNSAEGEKPALGADRWQV